MIQKKWTRFTRENVKKLPNWRGAYELANAFKIVIDQGGSDSPISGIRGRLLSHLATGKYPTARYFRVEFVGFLNSGIGLEASHAKRFHDKYGRKPKYTERSPRKRYLF
jgi:hypothetical protein